MKRGCMASHLCCPKPPVPGRTTLSLRASSHQARSGVVQGDPPAKPDHLTGVGNLHHCWDGVHHA